MIKKIENASEVFFSRCGMDDVIVLFEGKVLEPVWRKRTPEITAKYGYDEELTLQEIQEQFPYSGLMVICERPLSGEIYRLGGCDETTWSQVGVLYGYA